MTAIVAASYGPLTPLVVREGLESGKTFQRSCSCKCFNNPAGTLLAGHSGKCPLIPTCRMRSKHISAYQKKPQAKKIPRERLSVDTETTPVEDGPQSIAEVENGLISSDIAEHVPSVSNGIALSMMNAVEEDNQLLKGGAAAEDLAMEPLEQVSASWDQERFIDIVEDLMAKVKDAERNILMLNQVSMQTLEQLEQVRYDKENLQGQSNVLQMQLAEADAKLKLAAQEKVKIKLLEDELEVLQAKLAKDSEAHQVVSQLNTDYNNLQEYTKSLQERIDNLDGVEVKLELLKAENESFQEEIRSFRSGLADVNTKSKQLIQLETEKESLQKFAAELESKLAVSESNALELAKVKAEKKALLEKVQKLDANLLGLPTDKLSAGEAKVLQEKVGQLQAALAEVESEKGLLEQAQAENKNLRKQIMMLEQRLVESDAEIRSQLELYQAEVEAFQASLEQLKLEKSDALHGDTVDDMPWEFWSHLLLSIDGWMLEKQLTSEDAIELREMAWRRDRRIKDAFLARKGASDGDLIAGLLELIKAKKRPGLHIVHIAAEMAPVAKVGGLGDVVTGLGKALQKKGHLVEVVLPKYDCMDYSRINNLKVLDLDLNSFFDGKMFKNKIWLGTVEGLPVYFIEPHHPAKFFWRGQVYGENDDFRRFTYFCRAALEFLVQASKKPDIIHCHDWHTAAVAPLYWDVYVPQGLDSAKVAFTCHNFEYQGTENPEALASCGLDVQRLNRPDRMQDNFAHKRINLLKGAVVFSNFVTTVSPTYSQEVRGPEGGKGLHLTLTANAHKFFGILNGIDTEAWNPASDAFLEYQFSAEDPSGKAANKAVLRAKLQLSAIGLDSGRPLVGCITRLVPQKGVPLIRHAIYRTLERGGQFVLLGSSPISHIQHEFETIAHQFSNHPHIRLILKYDESLSHSIYAAADIFIIPSIFEPCGLTQMIAMRYGAIPVARRTGGLNDSVFDVDDETIPLQRRNGFTFSAADEQGLNHALDRAMSYFVNRPEWWNGLVRKAMKMDFSWDASADQYEELYQRAVAKVRPMT